VRTWLDKRAIDVKANYMDVLDENGDTLHTVSRVLCKSKDMYVLWDFMLGLDHAAVSSGIVGAQYPDRHTTESSTEADDVSSGTDVSQVKQLGKPPLRQNQLGSRTQNSPPEKIDALWLLNQFVNERFPFGGLFWTGDSTLFPKSTADLQAFQKYGLMMVERTLLTSNRFLKQFPHSDHSWSTEWLELLEEPNGLITLSTSLRWLRNVQTVRQNAASSTTSKGSAFRQKCSVYKLGLRKDGW
jgi:hypothetical protein